MAATFKITVHGEKLVQRILSRGEPEVRKSLLRALTDGGRDFTGKYQREHLRSPSGEPTATSVARRTGNLAKSFDFRVKGKRLNDLSLVLGFGPPAVDSWVGGAEKYAKTHLEGRTIRPRRGKYLAIPLDKTKAGVARRKSPRDLPGRALFLKKRSGLTSSSRRNRGLPNDRPVFVPRRSGKPGWVILFGGRARFVLVREVTVRKRLDLEKSFKKDGEPSLLRRLEAATDGAIRGLERIGG